MSIIHDSSTPRNNGTDRAYKFPSHEAASPASGPAPPDSPWEIGEVTDYSRIPILTDGQIIIEVLNAEDLICASPEQADAVHWAAVARARLVVDTFNLRRAVQDAVLRLRSHATERSALTVAEELGQALAAWERGWS